MNGRTKEDVRSLCAHGSFTNLTTNNNMMGKLNVPAAILRLAGVDCYYTQHPGSCVKEDLALALFSSTQSCRTSARRLACQIRRHEIMFYV